MFVIGDKVKTKDFNYLLANKNVSPGFVGTMWRYVSSECKITAVGSYYYLLDIDDGSHLWHKDWVEPVELDNRKLV